jgi:hypothetical protein
MNVVRLALVSLSVFAATSVLACASESGEGSSADEVNAGSGKISGFDLQGPKVLPKRSVPFCPAVVSHVKEACTGVRGETMRSGCTDLCSLPIATQGKVAGYDLKGFKQLPNGNAAATLCPQVISQEQAACERVGGTTVAADDCKVLCSEPIAPQGQAAGYDLSGFKIVPNDGSEPEICATVLSPVEEACIAVRGERTSVKGCGVLCSLLLK